jgi:hypothetical protein
MKKIFTLCSAVILGMTSYAQVTVVFAVDVNAYSTPIGATGMRIAGNFADHGAVGVANWAPTDPGSALVDQGNGIWATAITFASANIGDSLKYKFVNETWGVPGIANEGGDNSLIVTEGCGILEGNDRNRILVIPSTNSIVAKVWEGCEEFTFLNINEDSFGKLTVSPNPATASTVFALENQGEATIQLADLAGKIVSTTVGNGSIEVNTSDLNAGTYIYTVKVGDSVKTGKITKN